MRPALYPRPERRGFTAGWIRLPWQTALSWLHRTPAPGRCMDSGCRF
jgi:hypothetical protein